MKRSIGWILGLALLVTASGCMSVRLSTLGVDKPVMMTGAEIERDYSLVRSFSRRVKGTFTLFTLVTLSDPDVRTAVTEEIAAANGDAAINVTIEGETTFIDGLVGALTYQLYAMRTYTIEGDIIRYED